MWCDRIEAQNKSWTTKNPAMISRNYEPIQGVNPEQKTLAEWRRQCEKQNSHTHYIVSTPRLVAKI